MEPPTDLRSRTAQQRDHEGNGYVGDRENYVVRTYSSFLNGLVGSLTFGIYTPTSTVYYVPLKDIAPTHSVDVRNNEIIDLIEE